MKKFIQIIALSLLAVSFAQAQTRVQSLTEDYRGYITVNNTLLAEQQGQLHVVLDVRLHGQSVQNYAAIRLTPKLLTENNAIELQDILIMGGNKNKTYNRWKQTISPKQRDSFQESMIFVSPDVDTTFIYDVCLPYELWMDDAVLAINQEFIDYRDQRNLLVFALGGSVALEAKTPYQVAPKVNFIEPLPESKVRKMQGQAFLDFQAGRSEIVPSYRRNPEEIAMIQQALNDIGSNKNVTIKGLFIEGYASPEGKYKTNERLSIERANALKDYIIKNFNLPISYDNIRSSAVAEDWTGLRRDVESSGLAKKEQILAIIDNTPDPDQRELKLRQLSGGVWAMLLKDYFPQLRRVEYQIDFTVKDFTPDEAREMIGKSNMFLSQLELFRTAMSYGECAPEFENIILDIIPHQYKDDITANINAAALMIKRGELVTAKRILEKYADNPMTLNNLGVIELNAGELEKAQVLFEKAAAAGVKEAQHNLAEVDRKREDNAKMARYKR